MNVDRRTFLLTALGAGASGCGGDARGGAGPVFDAHVHLFGSGDAGSGCFLSPLQRQHPNYAFFLRLLDLRDGERMDETYVERLIAQLGESPVGTALLFAQDGRYDRRGDFDRGATSYYVPNVFVPLNTRLSPRELAAIAADSTPRLLLHGADPPPDLALPAHPVADLVATGDAARFSPATVGPAHVAQLYYTSGTTGRPKGVMLTHGNVAAHARAAVRELGLTATDRWAHVAPMFHLADAWATFAVTLVAGQHVFLPRFTPAAALALLADHSITITNLVPTMMLNLMLAEPGASDRGYALRAMLSGGAPIAPETVRRIIDTFRCDYVQNYGMTETSSYLTLSLLDDAQRRLPAEDQLRIKCRTGRPFLGVELMVVDDRGPVPRDDRTVGEVRVRGATVTPGYWQDPAATAAAFDADGFLRTGDLATIDASGSIRIVDRRKDVIKTGAETVYSTEVEHALHEHPAVLECAVYGVPDAVWGERVAAAVVLHPGVTADADELIAFCRQRIAHFKAPRLVRFLSELPKTGSGKIQKRLLREP
jgi:acyl-CoA synthetase (AMP-forming)/AMP-acid ligase II